LLVGGRPLVTEMLSEHLRHGDCYELERSGTATML